MALLCLSSSGIDCANSPKSTMPFPSVSLEPLTRGPGRFPPPTVPPPLTSLPDSFDQAAISFQNRCRRSSQSCFENSTRTTHQYASPLPTLLPACLLQTSPATHYTIAQLQSRNRLVSVSYLHSPEALPVHRSVLREVLSRIEATWLHPSQAESYVSLCP